MFWKLTIHGQLTQLTKLPPAKEMAGYRHGWWLKFDWIDRRKGTIYESVRGDGSDFECSRTGRRLESLSLLGGIMKIAY
jgi:hypothetical protein